MQTADDRFELGTAEVLLAERCVRTAGGVQPLTPLEVDLLRFLASQRGRTVSREQLLQEVWSYSSRAVTRAVDNTVSRLCRKIEDDPKAPRWLVSTRGGGYRLELPPVTVLPAEPDGLVGRAAEIAEIRAQLEQSARLLTLTGSGGIGKTRLAVRVASLLAGEAGAWFADLTTAHDTAEVAHATAQALDVALGPQDPVVQLGHALASRGRGLLVLDNADRIVVDVARAVRSWLERAPSLRVLVTSRARLGVAGEVLFEVSPLPRDAARALFVARAAAVRRGFSVAAPEEEALEQLLELLDGLPLAIELAAARANLLGPRELLARMSDRGLLNAFRQWRDEADRHRTLEATFDWSWRSCSIPPSGARSAR
ncbi:MAG: winged helix-turn-helix domain-containing protein [Myxococcota bacterium]